MKRVVEDIALYGQQFTPNDGQGGQDRIKMVIKQFIAQFGPLKAWLEIAFKTDDELTIYA